MGLRGEKCKDYLVVEARILKRRERVSVRLDDMNFDLQIKFLPNFHRH